MTTDSWSILNLEKGILIDQRDSHGLKRYTVESIVSKLRKAKVLMGISDGTYDTRRKKIVGSGYIKTNGRGKSNQRPNAYGKSWPDKR